MKMKISLLLAAAVCACALTAAPAMAFTEFVQKQPKSGNQTKGGKQVFKTKAGTFECEEEHGTGSSEAEKSSNTVEEAEYTKCKVSSVPATISPAQYKFSAGGTVSVENKIQIKAEPLGGDKCVIEIAREDKEGGKNENLGKVTYTNNNPGITLKAEVTGITYDVIENGKGLCGTVGAAKDGVYAGEAKTQTQPLACAFQWAPFYRYKDRDCQEPANRPFSGFYEYHTGYTNLEVK
jgi:hypothetical protein